MKVSALVVAPLMVNQALAFVPSQPSQMSSTALQAKKQNNIVAAASACLLGLGLSTQAAFATDASMMEQQQYFSPTVSSSTIVAADIDAFSLPSYDASKGIKLIDINEDVAIVNKRTMAAAKAKRETTDTSAAKKEADALRKAEKDGGSLLNSMLGNAEEENKASIAAEIAESRANRWKTF